MRWRHFAAVLNALIGEVFKEAAFDIHEYTETVSDYITFCESLYIPTKKITSYPNEKPWFNTYIKHKLQTKQDAYKDNDKDKYKEARDMQQKRPSRPVRPNTGTNLRKISPLTTLRTSG